MTVSKRQQITKSIFPDLINFMHGFAKITATLVDKRDIVASQENAGVFKMFDQNCKLMILPDIILIAECNQVARAETGAVHEVCSEAKPLVIGKHANGKRRIARKFAHYLDGIVRRPVVSDYQLGR